MNESVKSMLAKSFIAGVLIGIGGIVNLSVDNKYMGAFLFSVGLFTIIRFGFYLYTGKVGYVPEKKPAYLLEVLTTLIGNVIGTGAAALLALLTKNGPAIHDRAAALMEAKVSSGAGCWLSTAVFCGMLMYIAVDNGMRCKESGSDVSLVFGTVLPVMVFILSGFNHSVADCFYFFASCGFDKGVLYLIVVVCGNAVGGMTIPLVKKLFDDTKK